MIIADFSRQTCLLLVVMRDVLRNKVSYKLPGKAAMLEDNSSFTRTSG